MGRSTTLRTARHVLATAAAVAVVVVVLPRISGTGWTGIAQGLLSVAPDALPLLVGLWLAGLVVHTVALAGALPGLSHRRALTLSLTGSAVANVLPLGGAAGVALNGYMCRRWGFGPRQFAVYTALTNVWDVGAKLALLSTGALVLLATGLAGTPRLDAAALAGGVLALLLLGWAVWQPRGTRAVAGLVDALTGLARRHLGRGPVGVGARLVAVQQECREVVARRWPRLTLSVVGYHALLAVLLWACVGAVGPTASATVVLIGLAAERLLGLLNLTPGGLGLVDAGLAGVLIALGGDPVASVAAALIYRALTFGLEIPVGGALLLGWWALRRREVTGAQPA